MAVKKKAKKKAGEFECQGCGETRPCSDKVIQDRQEVCIACALVVVTLRCQKAESLLEKEQQKHACTIGHVRRAEAELESFKKYEKLYATRVGNFLGDDRIAERAQLQHMSISQIADEMRRLIGEVAGLEDRLRDRVVTVNEDYIEDLDY